jgi:hypothetical protein
MVVVVPTSISICLNIHIGIPVDIYVVVYVVDTGASDIVRARVGPAVVNLNILSVVSTSRLGARATAASTTLRLCDGC